MQISWQQNKPPHIENEAQIVQDYLFYTGSLTQKISSDSEDRFSLTVLSKSWRTLLDDEPIELDIAKDEKAFVREVLIFAANKAVIYARTVFPAQTLNNSSRNFEDLGNSSLGDILFKSDDCYRDKIEYTVLDNSCTLFQEIAAHTDLSHSERIYARRSLFYLDNKPLLVLEAFLPDIASIK